MAGGKMPGLARLIDQQREKSHIIRGVIENCSGGYSVSDFIARDLRDIVNETSIQEAVSRFRPGQLCGERIPEAIAELKEARLHTENSANRIMERAEVLMDSAADDAIAILEACAFQDIVGQRILKVVGLLESLEDRLMTLIETTGVVDDHEGLGEHEAEAELRRKELILHGPQMSGEGVSQDEIDALLGA